MIPMLKKEAQKRNPTTLKKKGSALGQFTSKLRSDEPFDIDD